MALTAIYALPEQALPIADVDLRGIGQQMDPPPLPGAIMVFLASDSQGYFGFNCPSCGGYWRAGFRVRTCPYCRIEGQSFQFLSNAQRSYIRHYCDVLLDALHSKDDGDFVIDMDAVADAALTDLPRPDFYVSEEQQQNQFSCNECGSFNDIIGRHAYCSGCGTRNDYVVLEEELASLRAQLTDRNGANILRQAVSNFDSLIGRLTRQLVVIVPMSKRRKTRIETGRFHDIDAVEKVLGWFDIQLFDSISGRDRKFINKMFLRRHVHEHNGGEVDEIYLKKSGDDGVRLRQHLTENEEDVHRLIGLIKKSARNVVEGFHELIPPSIDVIEAHRERERQRSGWRRGPR